MPTTYCQGDTVTCKVNYGKIAWANDVDYERLESFYIIALCDKGYLVLVSSDVFLANAFTLTKRDCKDFGTEEKFVGSEAHFINDNHVVSVKHRMEGLICSKCNIFCPMASRAIDEQFVCWSCKKYPFYKSST